LNDLIKMKWVIHYTMFFIVIILLFVFLHMQKHQYQTAKRQKQYIVQIEQYIHNESIHEENTHPIIETHQFMDLYIPIRA
jgi:cell division protein FtsI/penicillin-binding protein 2